MKIWTSEYTFNHPWETVAQAAWRKYPNPMNPAVLGTDVVDRKVIDGNLHTHRLVSSKWGLPKWVQTLIGPANICYASEHSIVNPKTKSMTLKTTNVTFGKFVAVDELVKYEPHPEEAGKTLLKQEAVITVQGVPLNSYMEDLLTSTIMLNANKGRQAIEWVIDKINTDVMEIKANAADGLKRSIGGITSHARKSVDEFSTAAKISFSSTSTKIPEV
ncbi:unnamed protein product [Nezara viridula]|uniref:PRELI/MSF1 domain-containing protein n=1 Tax=Nezara viridula TaxID=85310 RepID=A0A9P0E7V7_NEZVI|nr:unnamed protein product [Nezara viridula]